MVGIVAIMKKVMPIPLEHIPLVEKFMTERLSVQTRYKDAKFRPCVFAAYVRLAHDDPETIYLRGLYDNERLIGLLCGLIAPHPFFDLLQATNIAYQVEGNAGHMLLDDFSEWAKTRGASELTIGLSAYPEKHDAYKRLMKRQGFDNSELYFWRVL